MNRMRSVVAAMAALIAFVPVDVVRPAPAPAKRSGLDQVPATSPIVFHLRGAQGARDRLAAMMKGPMPDLLGKFLPKLDELLKNGENGRKPRGLAKNGPVFLAFTELPKAERFGLGPPKIAVIAAISNYKEFRDNLLTEEERGNIKSEEGVDSVTIGRETTYFVDRKNYVVVSPVEEVAKSFTKNQAGLDGKLSKEQAAKLLASDVGVYVDVEAVNKEYGEHIKTGRQEFEGVLDQAAGSIEDKAQKAGIDLVKKAIGPLFQTFEDAQGFLATAEFRPSGLAVHLEVEFRADSTTARLLQDSRPERYKELDRLPEGQAFYAAMKGDSISALRFTALMSGSTSVTELVTSLTEELTKAGPRTNVSGFSFPLAGLAFYHFDDPAKAVASFLKFYRDMDPKILGFKEKPTVKANAEKYGEFKLHHVQFAYDFEKMAEPLAKLGEEPKKKFIESMKNYLGEKPNAWFGTDGKVMVWVNAADWPTARTLLDRHVKNEKTLGKTPAFVALRKEMPSATSFFLVMEGVQFPTTVIELVKGIIGEKVPLPPGWPAPPSGDSPAYLGLAVTLQPRRGSFDAFIPGPAAGEVYKALIKPLLGE